MKKTFKLVLFLSLIMILSILVGCNAAAKKITEDDMTITLTKDFKKDKKSNSDWYYESADALVIGIKETKDELENTGLESNSLADYAVAVIETNNLPSSVKIAEEKNYLYFEYKKTINSTKYSYLVCVYENGDEYWTVNFACYEQRYKQLKEDFFKWADSVTFN